jgi:hypothetical protein
VLYFWLSIGTFNIESGEFIFLKIVCWNLATKKKYWIQSNEKNLQGLNLLLASFVGAKPNICLLVAISLLPCCLSLYKQQLHKFKFNFFTTFGL